MLCRISCCCLPINGLGSSWVKPDNLEFSTVSVDWPMRGSYPKFLHNLEGKLSDGCRKTINGPLAAVGNTLVAGTLVDRARIRIYGVCSSRSLIP